MRSKVFIGSRLIAIVESSNIMDIREYIRIEAIAPEPAVPVINVNYETPPAKTTGSSYTGIRNSN